MPGTKKARAIGFNHVALEVGNIDEALAFYGGFVDFEIRGKSETAAVVDLGDQFINFALGRRQGPDDARHFGLVVDDKAAARAALEAMGVALLPAAASSTFMTPGATVSRSSATTISSSPRPPMCFAAWVSTARKRPKRRSGN